jgi:hypothetical protein
MYSTITVIGAAAQQAKMLLLSHALQTRTVVCAYANNPAGKEAAVCIASQNSDAFQAPPGHQALLLTMTPLQLQLWMTGQRHLPSPACRDKRCPFFCLIHGAVMPVTAESIMLWLRQQHSKPEADHAQQATYPVLPVVIMAPEAP